MKTLKEKIAVMLAAANGKNIDSSANIQFNTIWLPCPCPDWNWANYDYRIKPEVPQYPVCYRWIRQDTSGTYYVPNFYKVQLKENYFLWFTHDFNLNYSMECYEHDPNLWESLSEIPPQIQLYLDKVYGILELLARQNKPKFKWYRHVRLPNYMKRIDDKLNIVSFYAAIYPERSPQNIYDIINTGEYYEIEEEIAVKYITENSKLWKLDIDPLGAY